MKKNMQFLLSVWFILLNMMSASSINFPASDLILSFLKVFQRSIAHD